MRYLIIWFWLFGLTTTVLAQELPAPVVQGELGARVDEYLTRLSGYGFWGTVLVAQGEQVILHKGYGWADREHALRNDTRTVYEIASLVKQFTATAILQLESAGKLKTRDTLSKYWPDVPADKRALTVQHLLTHTSGLPFECPGAAQLNRDEFVKCMLAAQLHAAPGQQYEYSNGGYGLLAALIERVSGQPYESYLQEHLFQPAGMRMTCFNGACGELQIGHGYDEAADRGVPQAQPLTWEKRGAWGLGATAADLWRWEQALRRNTVLNPAQTKKLFTAHVPTGGAGASYGYGWAVRKTAHGQLLIEHDGVTTTGYNALYRRYTKENVTVIIVSNRSLGSFMPMQTVAQALDGMLFQRPFVMPPAVITLSDEQLQPFVGAYQLANGAQLSVSLREHVLHLGAAGQEAVNLLCRPDEQSAALLARFNERSRQIIEGIRRGDYEPYRQASADALTAEQARDIGSTWLNRLEQKNGALKSIETLGTMPEAGFLRSFVRLQFERGTEIRRLRWENGKLVSILIGTPPLLVTALQPQSATEFTGLHLGLKRLLPLRFELDQAGRVTGLRLHQVTAVKVPPGKAE